MMTAWSASGIPLLCVIASHDITRMKILLDVGDLGFNCTHGRERGMLGLLNGFLPSFLKLVFSGWTIHIHINTHTSLRLNGKCLWLTLQAEYSSIQEHLKVSLCKSSHKLFFQSQDVYFILDFLFPTLYL